MSKAKMDILDLSEEAILTDESLAAELSIPSMHDDKPDSEAEDASQSEPETGGGGGPGEASIWTFMGAVGGCGVTSIAVQVAYDLARRRSDGHPASYDPRVCLIDLDFENGMCPQYLDILPSLQLSDLQGGAARIDAALAGAMMSRHDSGISLLAANCGVGGNDAVNPQTVLALMDTASKMFEHVILDVPRMWRPWTHAAIAAADRFGLVTEMNIPALHACRTKAEALAERIDANLNVDFIVNKFERRSLRNALRPKDAEKALRRHVSHYLAVDVETNRDAVNCGEPAGAIKPESRFAKDVHALANIFAGIETPEEREARFFGLNRRRAATG